MPYIDLDYYKNTYKGAEAAGGDDDTEKAIDRAADLIDMYVGGATDPEAEGMTTAEHEYLKKANASQAEYIILNGEGYNEAGGAGNISSAKIGKMFSYTTNNTSKDKTAGGAINNSLAPLAIEYLDLADLVGGGTCVI